MYESGGVREKNKRMLGSSRLYVRMQDGFEIDIYATQ